MRRPLRAGLFGGDERLPGLVRHVLRGLGFKLGAVVAGEPPPDLVLVAVEHGHVTLRVAAARERAHGAPVLAILRLSDAKLAGRALAAGAHACYALDTSLEYLRDQVLLLGHAMAEDRRVRAAA